MWGRRKWWLVSDAVERSRAEARLTFSFRSSAYGSRGEPLNERLELRRG